MRKLTVVLLALVSGCSRPSTPAATRSNPTETPTASMTDAQRQATEDSAKAWLTLGQVQFERGDSAGMMGTYLADGPLVSAWDGKLVTSRDSVAQMLAGLSQVAEAKATFGDTKIDVLAPGVAAVTATYRFQGANQGQKFDNRGVYSAVLAERDGRMRVVQEHNSMLPRTRK